MPTDFPDAPVEVRATSLAHGGEAVCRTASGVVFVPGLLPGETARVQLTQRKQRFARAKLLELLEPAPYRLSPACPAAAAGAGCCDLSVTDAATAASLKAQIAGEQFARLGGLSGPLVDDLPAEQLQQQPVSALSDCAALPAAQLPMRRWRTVARWHVGADGRIGSFAAGSNEVITAARCTQVVAELAELADAVDAAACLPAGAELVARADPDGSVCAAWRRPAARAPGGSGRRAAQRRRAAAARAPRWQALPPELGIRDQGKAGDGQFVWELPAWAFWQPHRQAVACYQRHIAAALDAVLDDSTAHGSATQGEPELEVWDLYSGVGALTWGPLAAAAKRGRQIRLHQVESAPEACAAARAAQEQLPPGMHSQIHQQQVARWLSGLSGELDRSHGPDLVVADPPRTGLEPDVIGQLAALRPRQLVHIGCDIAAAARDVGALVRSGFALHAVTVVDAFPGTHHAEVVTRLSYPELIGKDSRAT